MLLQNHKSRSPLPNGVRIVKILLFKKWCREVSVRNSFPPYEDLKIPDMHFASQNTPHVTLGNDQYLKVLQGVCNTKKRGDLSLSLLETYWDGREGGWCMSRPRRRRYSPWRWSGSSGCSLPSGFELNKKIMPPIVSFLWTPKSWWIRWTKMFYNHGIMNWFFHVSVRRRRSCMRGWYEM